jgi:hypothetical protein
MFGLAVAMFLGWGIVFALVSLLVWPKNPAVSGVIAFSWALSLFVIIGSRRVIVRERGC